MKKLITSFFLLLLFALTHAQNQAAFKSIGKKQKVYTLSNDRFVESFINDTIQQIGSVKINTVTGHITKLLTAANIGSAEEDLIVGSRFLSVDPITNKFPEQSPYQYSANSPISHVDIEGKYALFIHYMLTKYLLKQAGVSEVKAKLIAHYTSIFADNPGGVNSAKESGATGLKTMGILISNINGATSNNPIFGEMGGSKLSIEEATAQLHYLPGIDYSKTKNSQTEGADPQKWHSTRTYAERNMVSAAAATNRSVELAWNNIFKAADQGGFESMTANSPSIEYFSQGLHAFQDMEAHGGAVFRATFKNGQGLFSSDGNEHNLNNDTHPEQNKFLAAKYLSTNAIKVFQILSGNIGKLERDNGDISTNGMNKNQIATLLDKIKEGGYTATSTGQNTYRFHK